MQAFGDMNDSSRRTALKEHYSGRKPKNRFFCSSRHDLAYPHKAPASRNVFHGIHPAEPFPAGSNRMASLAPQFEQLLNHLKARVPEYVHPLLDLSAAAHFLVSFRQACTNWVGMRLKRKKWIAGFMCSITESVAPDSISAGRGNSNRIDGIRDVSWIF